MSVFEIFYLQIPPGIICVIKIQIIPAVQMRECTKGIFYNFISQPFW